MLFIRITPALLILGCLFLSATVRAQIGELGARRSISFHQAYDMGLLTHSGGVLEYGNGVYTGGDGTGRYPGGDPGCCEKCRNENTGGSNPSVWGRTDFYNFDWDNQYNYNSCECYAGPSDPKKFSQIPVLDYGPVAGHCGNNAAFSDLTLGDDVAFVYQSVEDLGSAWDGDSVDMCCQECKKKFPESESFEFHKYNKYCSCYKTISGKLPETRGEGAYAGACNNQ